MNNLVKAFALAALITVPAGAAIAQDAAPKTLQQVMQDVRNNINAERAEEQQRVREFQREKSRQQELLAQARAEKARLQAESNRLEAQFDENERQITQLEGQLRERQGNLAELFGIVKQSSEDLRGFISQSLVSVELADREEFLNNLAQKRDLELPTTAELKKFWEMYLQEIVESGRVSRFTAQVSTEGGLEDREVVRVGSFNLISDGAYLQYADGAISEFPAQPPGRFVSSTSDLANASEGMVGFGVDPSGGQILATFVRVPSLWERFQFGGVIGYIIALLGIFGVLLVIYRWVYLFGVGSKVNSQMKSGTASDDNPLGRVMAAYDANKGEDVETLELKLDEAILKETPKIEAALPIIKVISVVAPLMGLLGTVTGMILTFQAITLFGAGDPQIMAGGISQALVTTVLGLVVAIPMTLLYTVVSSRAKRIIHVLEEQAAGIVALHAEKSS